MQESVLQYVGARYVPLLYKGADGSMEWEANTYYEPLTIVTYNNSSYTSRSPVPATVGNPPENPTYWALTGNYNGYISQLQEQINALQTILVSKKSAPLALLECRLMLNNVQVATPTLPSDVPKIQFEIQSGRPVLSILSHATWQFDEASEFNAIQFYYESPNPSLSDYGINFPRFSVSGYRAYVNLVLELRGENDELVQEPTVCIAFISEGGGGLPQEITAINVYFPSSISGQKHGLYIAPGTIAIGIPWLQQ